MKKRLNQCLLGLCIVLCTQNTMALSDAFYSTGEDLEYMYDAEENLIIEDIERTLRRFVIYRKLENILFDYQDDYPGISQ